MFWSNSILMKNKNSYKFSPNGEIKRGNCSYRIEESEAITQPFSFLLIRLTISRVGWIVLPLFRILYLRYIWNVCYFTLVSVSQATKIFWKIKIIVPREDCVVVHLQSPNCSARELDITFCLTPLERLWSNLGILSWELGARHDIDREYSHQHQLI